MVREAVRNAVPAQRKKTERLVVKMAAATTLIDAILESDWKAPRKQRHTARRIYDRIRAEVPGCTPAERTVRQYVERRKRELGLAEHETFVPQSYRWSVEAQIDFHEPCQSRDFMPEPSIWNTTSRCSTASLARCAVRRRWRSGGLRAGGPCHRLRAIKEELMRRMHEPYPG
jgi:hypothetical protein